MIREDQMSRAGVERSAFAPRNIALSENGGQPGGQFGTDSDSAACLGQRIQDSLNAVERDLQRLAAAETPDNRNAVELVRGKLAGLMETWEQICGKVDK